VHVVDEIAVGDHLRIVANLRRRLHGRVDGIELQQPLDPCGTRARGEMLAEDLDQLEPDRLVDPLHQRIRGVEILAFDGLAELLPVSYGREHHQHQPLVVLAEIAVHDRVGGAAAVVVRQVVTEEQRGEDVRRHQPHRRPEQRDVDDRPLTGLLAMVESSGDPAGDERGADGIAEGGALHDRRLARLTQHVRDAAARPERAGIESTALGFRPLGALAGPLGVDDLRVDLLQVVVVDLQAPSSRGQEAGQEDVGFLHQGVQHLAPAVGAEIEPEAAFVAAAVLDEEVEAVGAGNDAGADQAAQRIAAGGMLDLDDLGAPVGNHRPGTGHEEPFCHFDQADPVEHLQHSCSLRTRVCAHSYSRMPEKSGGAKSALICKPPCG